MSRLRKAFLSPQAVKYIKANNPDSQKLSKKMPKQAKTKVGKALMAQTGDF